MKKAFVVFIVIATVGTFTIAQPLAQSVKKYWQDVILKPNQGWIASYGYNGESVLAYNVRSLLARQQVTMREVATLKAQVAALMTPVDVNEPNGVD